MGCISDCKICTSVDKADAIIVNPSYPQTPVTPGTNVSVSFVIKNNTISSGYVNVCLYDVSSGSGSCLGSVTVFLYPYLNTGINTINFIMPAYDTNLKLSVSYPDLFGFTTPCFDFYDFTIQAYFPPGTTFSCINGKCGINNSCTPGNNCYSERTCGNSCGTPITPCPSDKIPILGQCFAKNDIYLAVGIGLVFLFVTRK